MLCTNELLHFRIIWTHFVGHVSLFEKFYPNWKCIHLEHYRLVYLIHWLQDWAVCKCTISYPKWHASIFIIVIICYCQLYRGICWSEAWYSCGAGLLGIVVVIFNYQRSIGMVTARILKTRNLKVAWEEAASLEPHSPHTLQCTASFPKKFSVVMGIWSPHLIHCFLGQPNPHSKWHHDRIIRFFLELPADRLTDWQNRHGTWTYATSAMLLNNI